MRTSRRAWVVRPRANDLSHLLNRENPMHRRLLALCCCAGSLLAWDVLNLSADQGKTELPLLFRDRFEKGADQWEPTDTKAWKVIETDQGKAYSQFQQSKYKPPHRSPFNIALRKDLQVGDFVLEAKVKTTARGYPRGDLCLI